jgi:hypothetical protein
MVPFKSLAGKFEQEGYGGKLEFRDVVISLAAGEVVTDAFSIEKGKLTLGPIYLIEGQERLRIR